MIRIKLKKDMKFATLFIIGGTGGMSLNYAQRNVNRLDTNGDGCLEWNEFKAPIVHRNKEYGMSYSP